jgi:hypothetical protein
LAASRSRNSDAKLIAGASVAVLLAGGLLAIGVFTALRGGNTTACPELNIGVAGGLRQQLESGGPFFTTGGENCGFWLALDDGDFAAYKVKQPSGCTLKLKRDHWECSGETVDAASLAQFPVSIRTIEGSDAVIVDLRPPVASSSTSTSTSSSVGR